MTNAKARDELQESIWELDTATRQVVREAEAFCFAAEDGTSETSDPVTLNRIGWALDRVGRAKLRIESAMRELRIMAKPNAG